MTKQMIVSLLCIFSIATTHSQELSRYKCAYETTVLRDTVTFQSYPKDTYIVQIGDDITKGFYYKKFYADSLESANKELFHQIAMQDILELNKYLEQKDPDAFDKASNHFVSAKPFYSTLYKDYNKNEMTVIDKVVLVGNYVFTDELKPQDWQILPDTMTILGYHSQKATCHYRGRNWIAWFTTEIPLSEGPWKFYGLPGLITKIADEQEHYSFVLTGFQEIEEPIDTEISKKAEKTTREKFIKTLRDFTFQNSARNVVLDNIGVDRPATNKNEKGRVRYDYIETDYKGWVKEK